MTRCTERPLSRPSPLRAVIFDFDGVIADTEAYHLEAFGAVLAEEGLPISTADYEERFLGLNDRAGFDRAFREAGRPLPPEKLEGLLARKSTLYRARLPQVRPCPGAPELVLALARRFPLAIASGGRGAEILEVLGRHGLRQSFRGVVSADEVPRSKPAPDVYLEALALLRGSSRGEAIEAPGCLAIEDTPPGIEAARAAGLRCLAVAHTYPPGSLQRADRVVGSLEETSVEDLMRWASSWEVRAEGPVPAQEDGAEEQQPARAARPRSQSS